MKVLWRGILTNPIQVGKAWERVLITDYTYWLQNCYGTETHGRFLPEECKPVIRRGWSTTQEDIDRKGVY